MISLELLYFLAGLILACCAIGTLFDRAHVARYSTAAFWGAYAAVFLVGRLIPPAAVGSLVILMSALAGLKLVRAGTHAPRPAEQRSASARSLGGRLIVPALLIPVVTIGANYALRHATIDGMPVLSRVNPILAALGLACVIALIVALIVTRASPRQVVHESRRLIDSLGWTLVLPQALAMLGLIFIEAGAGKAVSGVLVSAFDMNSKLTAITVFAIGLALLTFVLGNAFAAFPLMAAGVGVPILVHVHHISPAIMAAVGMFCAYCGSAMTPMNATYSILPTALLDIPDKYAVIKAQIPTVLPLLFCNIALLYMLS